MSSTISVSDNIIGVLYHSEGRIHKKFLTFIFSLTALVGVI